jgi:RNA polymerase sigma-70 factor (ECF subfamily)
MKPPLQALALLAADGDDSALDALLDAIDTHKLARPAIARQLFNIDDQDDVEQDVLINVARSITGFRGESNLLTWLHTVATNCALGFVRKRQETAPLPDDMSHSFNAKFTSIATTNMAVYNAIAQLPEPYRDVVTMRDLQHLSYADIAAQLDANLNTVRARIARGRALVANQLGTSVAGMEQP